MEKKGKVTIILVIMGILIIGVIALLVIQVPYTSNVIYNDKEPYNTQKCHNEKIKWVLQSPCSTSWAGGGGATGFHYSCKITNEDSTGGIFTVKVSTTERWTLDSGEDVYTYGNYSKEGYVGPDETKVIGDDKLWAIGVSPKIEKTEIIVLSPTKNVCDTIPDYKDVSKTKTETRFCSALNKLFGKC